MNLNELFKNITREVRVYKFESEEAYPIVYWPLEKALKYKKGIDPKNDYPNIPGLMVSQCSIENQDKTQSDYFLDLYNKASTVYQQIIFINRAIDYDMVNLSLYDTAIEFYSSLFISEDIPFVDELMVEVERYENVKKEIEKYNSFQCTVPILFDLDAKKRVELDAWVLNNRRKFPEFINKKFVENVKTKSRGAEYFWNASEGKLWPVSLFEHQKFISDFLSEETPYRGCLLYYGLGSGKTLSSINVAEGINKRVVVLLPAALRNNYINDLYKKGCTLYHKKNHWCFVEMKDYLQPSNLDRLTKMGFPTKNTELISKLFVSEGPNGNSGFWCVQKNATESNYKAFSEDHQKSIAKTVHLLREYKYLFIHYNSSGNILRQLMSEHLGTDIVGGKTISIFKDIVEPRLIEKIFGKKIAYKDLDKKEKNKLKKATLEQIFTPNEKDGLLKTITNPFENKVIIIDEAHNFMSMLSNSSNELDKSNYLYQLIMRAENCRIATLTGTPIINSPFEISLLFNMLRGYSINYIFELRNKIDNYKKKEIENILEKNQYIDQFKFNDINRTFSIIRVPYGFRRVNENEIAKDNKSPTNNELFQNITASLETADAGIYDVNLEKTKYFSIFPDIYSTKHYNKSFIMNKSSIQNAFDEFNSYYINKIDGTIINENEFMYRSLGLISFYNEISVYGRDIFPEKIQSDTPDYVDISDYQLLDYNEMRKIEREMEKTKSNDIDKEVSNVFKVFSRERLLFTFPPGLVRPDKKIIRENLGKDAPETLVEKVYREKIQKVVESLNVENLTINDSPYALQNLSPKFAKILENIHETPGLVFGYSQFRSVEGLEIFSHVLSANGYERIKFRNVATAYQQTNIKNRFKTNTELELVESESVNHTFNVGNMVRFEVEPDKWRSYIVEDVSNDGSEIKLEGIDNMVPAELCYRCRFAIWSGEESTQEREMIIKMYKERNNLYGQELLILLTTSSGAEGINLKYVRQVHIMEPYWNKVRIEQVIGRARRIESHTDLPKDQRNVKIFLYVSRFSENQMNGTWGTNLDFGPNQNENARNDRITEITNQIKFTDKGETSDQVLLKITNNKYQIIEQFLNLLKRSAVDCEYNRERNIASDPSLANLSCVKRVEGSNVFAYNIEEEPKPREVGFLERELQRSIYRFRLPYLTTDGKIINLLYEDEPNSNLRELQTAVPIFNFYTYYGINPISNNPYGTKELIGSISRDAATGQLKIILHQNFVNLFGLYEQIEGIIEELELDIPNYNDENLRFQFIRDITNNPKYKELLEQTQEFIIPSADILEKPKKRTIKLNIKKK